MKVIRITLCTVSNLINLAEPLRLPVVPSVIYPTDHLAIMFSGSGSSLTCAYVPNGIRGLLAKSIWCPVFLARSPRVGDHPHLHGNALRQKTLNPTISITILSGDFLKVWVFQTPLVCSLITIIYRSTLVTCLLSSFRFISIDIECNEWHIGSNYGSIISTCIVKPLRFYTLTTFFIALWVLFLVPSGTNFHLELSHAVHTRLRKYWNLSLD